MQEQRGQTDWYKYTLDLPLAHDPDGDKAKRALGLIHGLLHGLDWRATGQIASLLGALKIESRGTQNHKATAAQLATRLRQSFG